MEKSDDQELPEIPQYFMCPISLQIMKDPVTAVTGITYDRESIEHWIFTRRNTTCPVTKQPLISGNDDSVLLDITPNHTLRRLIQSWCTCHGRDRIPSPKPILDRFRVGKLLRGLSSDRILVLRQLEALASEHERNRRHLVDAGVPEAMFEIVLESFDSQDVGVIGLSEAVRVLRLVRICSNGSRSKFLRNDRVMESLTWLMGFNGTKKDVDHVAIRSNAVSVMRLLLEEADLTVLERLRPDFFKNIVGFLKNKPHNDKHAINSALTVMLQASPWGKNRIAMVESGAVFELLELELALTGSLTESKRTTELVFGVLFNLCCCAEGRAKLLTHRAGIAAVARVIMKVSPAVDKRAVMILSSVCKFSGTNVVLQEMLTMKAVSKLCLLMQSDATSYLKEKAAEMLRIYSSEEWKSNPCMDACLLSRVVLYGLAIWYFSEIKRRNLPQHSWFVVIV